MMEIILLSNMKRNLWVKYKWVLVNPESGIDEPRYLRSGLRPIEETVKAAEQFDTMRNAYLSENNNEPV